MTHFHNEHSERPRWRDLEKAALTDPVIQQALELFKREYYTRIEALIVCVLEQSKIIENQRNEIVRLLEITPVKVKL